MTKQNVMCVGGPHDGKCLQIETEFDWFQAPIYPAAMFLPVAADGIKPVEETSIQIVTYVKRDIFGVCVWAVDTMRPADILNLFYTRYFSGDASKTRETIEEARQSQSRRKIR